MSEKKIQNYNFRASFPTILRYAGIVGAVATILAVSVGFYLATSREEFRSGDFPGELSENVVGIVNGYNRREAKNGVLQYTVRADIAKTFDDNHQELDNIVLQLYKDGNSDVFDKITADRAVYLPKPDGNDFTIFFAGDVAIRTASDLVVNTDQLSYRSNEEIAKAEEAVVFSRFNISGKSFGAVVNVQKETLELSRDVEIYAAKSDQTGAVDLGVKLATLRAGYAFVEGRTETIRLRDKVSISLTPAKGDSIKQPSDISSLRAVVYLVDREIRRIELDGDVLVKQYPTSAEPGWLNARAGRSVALVDKSLERLNLFDNVRIETNRKKGNPVLTRSDSGTYQKNNDTFELSGSVEIITNRDAGQVRAVAGHAVYKQSAGEVLLDGGAEIQQARELIKGDSITAELNPDNTLKFAASSQNAYLKQQSDGRLSEVFSDTLKAWFQSGEITSANARGVSRIDVLPSDRGQYARFRLSTPKGIDLSFRANGDLSEMSTIGRTTLHLDAGSDPKSAADKTLTADSVKTAFRASGNDLAKAHAIGDAKLLILPKSPSAGKFRTTITAPRFDCDFYPGNNARNCKSTKRSKLIRTLLKGPAPDQVLEADGLNSHFDRVTRNAVRYEAVGKSKFREGEKQGIAERIDYTPGNGMVALRGGAPTVWDNGSRAKAGKIDWNTELDESSLSDGVSTTYYSQKKTGNAAPFSQGGSPVFLTSDSAKFDHGRKTALYVGNARAWQEKNYVRGDKIYIEEVAGRFFAEGNVQSLVYESKSTLSSGNSKSPVFVSAGSMLYLRDKRQIRYLRDVDIRQGPERAVSNEADVFLDENDTITSTVLTGSVVITQPGRKATGSYIRHDAVAETVELKGEPATFSDREAGITSGKVVNVDLKTNRTVNSGSSTRTGTGRTRSVYKVKEGRIN